MTLRRFNAAARRTLFAAGIAGLSPLASASPGDPLGLPVRVNTTTTGDQQNASVARAANGDSMVCWDSNDGSLSGIFAQRFNADGTKSGPEFRVNTHTDDRQISCDVAMDASGRAVVVWRGSGQDGSGSGIFGQRYAANGARLGEEFQVNLHTKDAQGEPNVAMNAQGEFAVAWSERALIINAGSADRRTICARAFKADGSPRNGDQLNVYTEFGPRVLTPGIGIADDGSFVVAYFRDGSPNTVNARRFLPTGFAVGTVFKVAAAPAGIKYDLPTVAMNAAGDFAIVWEATFPDGTRAGLYGRRYVARGLIPPLPVITIPTVPKLPKLPPLGQLPEIPPLPPVPTITPTDPQGALGPPFRIDTDEHLLGRASAAMNADRSFVVAGDADNAGIYLQRFAADGSAVGPQSRADTTEFQPLVARVAVDGTGNYAVTWESFGEDGSRRGINLRRFQGP